MITAVSLFSGCGGFDTGVKRLGVKLLWANDNNRNAASTYQRYFPETEFKVGDIRNIEKKQIPEADLLIGCYPCQGFSNAAWRRWGDRDERNLFKNEDNFLFLEFANVIPFVKPKFVFIENVPGLQSSVKGHFFEAQRKALTDAGYTVYHAQLSAHEYGVAQTRKRIFIVGVHNSLNFPYTYPEPTHGPNRKNPYKTQVQTISHLPEWPHGEFDTAKFHGHYLTRQRKRSWESCSYTIVAESDHVTLHPMGEPMRCISRDHWELQGAINRRLSWRECALLQSFDEDFEPAGPMTAKYAQIGNAVPPLMAELIVKPTVEFLQQGDSTLPDRRQGGLTRRPRCRP